MGQKRKYQTYLEKQEAIQRQKSAYEIRNKVKWIQRIKDK